MKQGYSARQAVIESGFDPANNYLKYEIHIKNPAIINGRTPITEQLQSPSFIDNLNEFLLSQYKTQLKPMRTIQQITDKKQLSALDLMVSMYLEDKINMGRTLEEAKKEVFSKINSVPESILKKCDKDSRKNTLRKAFDKVDEEPRSRWDLEDQIRQALETDQF